jgi:hypothetical protein
MGITDYDVAPAGGFARAFPFALAGVFATALVVVLATSLDRPMVLMGALPALLVAIGVALGFAWLVRHPRVQLRDAVLQVGRFPRLHAPVETLDLAAARVVDLAAEPALQPVLRLMGTSLPGLNSGWFWLRDRSRAFLVVTDRGRVLVLPRRGGGPVLLSLLRPDALLEALRQARG